MIELLVVLVVVALVAGGLGFSGLAKGAASAAKMVFGIMVVLALLFVAMIMFGINLFV